MSDFFRTHLPVPEPIYNEIGRVAAHWELLEQSLQSIVWTILNLERFKGRLLTHTLRSDTVQDILKVLTDSGAVKHEAEALQALLVRVSNLRPKRNQVVHATWLMGNSFDQVVAERYANKKPVYTPFTAQDVHAIYEEIHTLQTDLNLYAHRYYYAASNLDSLPEFPIEELSVGENELP